MNPGAVLANPNAVSHVEVAGFVLATLDTVGVVDIFDKELVDKFSLLGRLPLQGGRGRWDDRGLDEGKVGVRSRGLVRQLLGGRHPGRLLPLRQHYGLRLRRRL